MSYCSRSRRRRCTYWTSKVEHIVAFAAIFSNICTAHAQKRLFMNFRCEFRHHRSIRRPRFPISVQNFGDLESFYDNYCILYSECPPDITRVDPHVDNSHQVWSWYDHTLQSFSVFVCWYVTWHCDLDLLTFNSCSSWRVTWPRLLPTLKTPCLSVLDLWVITFPVGYPWECVRRDCACAKSRDLFKVA